MASETMTPAERLATALAFEKPDRVPVGPQIVKSTAAKICGVTFAEAERDIDLALRCMLKTFDDVGGWDALYLEIPDTVEMQILKWQLPLVFKVPGVDLPDNALLQVHEQEVLAIADYDRIIEEGFTKFYYDDYVYRTFPFEAGSVPAIMDKLDAFYEERVLPEWQKREIGPYMVSPWSNHPFFELSLARSFTKFTEDLYYRPELVEKALRRMTEDWIAMYVDAIRETGLKAAYIVEERASAFYYPLSIFERFWWPFTVEFVKAMQLEGAVTVMHLDTNWAKNLPYFKRDLPKGSYVLQMDTLTDMSAAKELLKGHAMFHGDLPAAVQAFGSVEDVQNYCKKLIDEVGYEGGFILGTGCDTAPDFKPENLRAMIETARTYEASKRV